MILYEAIELPDKGKVQIHVTCGPYIVRSKFKKIVNSKAVWNETELEIDIRAPEIVSQIPDVIIYLSKSEFDE